MSDHEWCRDVPRDEAVRAAEDAAAVPAIQHRDLPEIVADLRERVARLEAAMMPKSVSGSIAESLENKGGTMPAEGLRTKRVTLEVRWNPDREPWSRVAEWLQAALLSEWFGAPGESVCVVDEADAASDEAVAHGATLSALAEARESLAAANRGIARLTAERDAAKEECERLRQSARGETLDNVRLRQQTHDLRARVAELEAAAAVRPIGWIARHEQSPPVGKYVMCRWDVSARPGYAREVGYGVAKRGRDGMWRAPSGVEKIAPMHWMPLLPGVEGGDAWEAPLASAPAANAGVEKQEPVAWGVRRSDGTWWRDCRATRGEMLSVVTGGGDANNVVSPLYAGPPRGWLTAEERETVEKCLRHFVRQEIAFLERNDPGNRWLEVWRSEEAILRALLARSTPPRVKVPNLLQQNTWQSRDSQWIAAIRAAGGEVEG